MHMSTGKHVEKLLTEDVLGRNKKDFDPIKERDPPYLFYGINSCSAYISIFRDS